MQRKYLLLLVQALVSVALMALLFRGVDMAAFASLYRRLPAWFYFASLSVVLGGQVLYAWRWRLLLVANGVDVRIGTVLRQYFIGTFLNNFLPTTVGGDVAKVYYVGREHGYRPVAASVILDRLLGLGLLAFLSSLTLWMIPAGSPAVATARAVTTAIAAAAVMSLALAVLGTGGLAQRVARFGPRSVAFAARLQRLRLDMAAAAGRLDILGKAFGVVVSYFVALTVVYQGFIRLSAPSVPPFLPLLTVVTTTAVLSNIPISLNGIGLREQLHVLLLQPLGVPREMAVAISLLLYGHLLIASVCGLFFWAKSPAMPSDAHEHVAV